MSCQQANATTGVANFAEIERSVPTCRVVSWIWRLGKRVGEIIGQVRIYFNGQNDNFRY